MKKFLFLLCLPVAMALAFTSCSGSDDDGENDGSGGGGGNLTENVIKERLPGEWICYYQKWEEDGEDRGESYYNNDDLSLTFNEDLTGYLKSEGEDELLEVGRSEYFAYSISGKNIIVDDGEVLWKIIALSETELELKSQDGTYIIIAKFVRRASLAGKVSKLSFRTEYNSDYGSYDYETYSFSYDFRGELNGITINNKTLTYGPLMNGERYITWYDGKRLRLVDKKDDGKYAEVFQNNALFAEAKYDTDGFLSSLNSGSNSIKFGYTGGNLSSMEFSGNYMIRYEYSEEKNDAGIDLNYFIGYFKAFNEIYCRYDNYVELGLEGKRSVNLVSRIVTPEDFDFYFTYSYEKDSRGHIAKITRTCGDNHNSGNWLNRSTINVEYYDE